MFNICVDDKCANTEHMNSSIYVSCRSFIIILKTFAKALLTAPDVAVFVWVRRRVPFLNVDTISIVPGARTVTFNNKHVGNCNSVLYCFVPICMERYAKPK
jgi:hypothetical protein